MKKRAWLMKQLMLGLIVGVVINARVAVTQPTVPPIEVAPPPRLISREIVSAKIRLLEKLRDDVQRDLDEQQKQSKQ